MTTTPTINNKSIIDKDEDQIESEEYYFVLTKLKEIVANILQVPQTELLEHTTLTHYGMSSINTILLLQEINLQFLELSLDILSDNFSLHLLSKKIISLTKTKPVHS